MANGMVAQPVDRPLASPWRGLTVLAELAVSCGVKRPVSPPSLEVLRPAKGHDSHLHRRKGSPRRHSSSGLAVTDSILFFNRVGHTNYKFTLFSGFGIRPIRRHVGPLGLYRAEPMNLTTMRLAVGGWEDSENIN